MYKNANYYNICKLIKYKLNITLQIPIKMIIVWLAYFCNYCKSFIIFKLIS